MGPFYPTSFQCCARRCKERETVVFFCSYCEYQIHLMGNTSKQIRRLMRRYCKLLANAEVEAVTQKVIKRDDYFDISDSISVLHSAREVDGRALTGHCTTRAGTLNAETSWFTRGSWSNSSITAVPEVVTASDQHRLSEAHGTRRMRSVMERRHNHGKKLNIKPKSRTHLRLFTSQVWTEPRLSKKNCKTTVGDHHPPPPTVKIKPKSPAEKVRSL